tara:strand:+ start:767 stop:979 length:213 start_codon:yes stop_codon:yes gene_type:complete
VDKILNVVNKELEQFNKWFTSQGNSPLVSSELAILRTFLVAKKLNKFPFFPENNKSETAISVSEEVRLPK